MTTFLTMTLYAAIITFVFLGILLLYRGLATLYWMWKIKYDYSNTKYEYKKVSYHKRKSIIVTPIIIILGLIMLFYKAPVNFEKIIDSKDYPNKVESIYLFRASSGNSENRRITDKKELNNILNVLSEHRYTRNLHESRFGNRIRMLEDEFISLTITLEGNYHIKTFYITGSGYINDANTGQAYKVNTENEIVFFNRLINSLSDISYFTAN
jgi:heme/copper-type cytochrome/quinol oxidase subunit 2